MTDNGDSARTEPITFYLSEREKEALKREADRAGDSLSTHVARLVRKQRQVEAEDELAEQLSPEKRLMDIVARGKDEFKHVADHTKDVQARSAVYSIALWELQKQNYPDVQRKRALVKAADRLHDRLGDHPGFQDEVDEILARTEVEPDSDVSADDDDNVDTDAPSDSPESADSTDDDDIFRR